MLISALCDYYDVLAAQEKVLPSGYSSVGINYLISLTPNGEIASIMDWQVSETREVAKKMKEVFAPRNVLLPKRTEKSAIDSNIVEHRPAYIFGLVFDKDIGSFNCSDKATKSHEAFIAKNVNFIDGIDVPVVNAYRSFMQNWVPEQETENPLLSALGKKLDSYRFAFCLEGRPDILLHEVPELREKWESEFSNIVSDKDSYIAQCAIMGDYEPIAKLHGKIKGVPGGNPTGTLMSCFNNPCDASYGAVQSLNSKVSERAMGKYTEALNFLLADRKHKTAIDDTVYVHWASSKDERYDDLLSALSFDAKMDADATDIWLNAVLDGIRAGKASEQILEGLKEIDSSVQFYVVGMKPNSSRIAVKCIYRQSVGKVLENAIQHRKDMQISSTSKPASLWRIAKELVSPKSSNDNAPPALMSKIMEAVILGTPYPVGLLQTLVTRIKIDSDTDKDSFIKMNDIRMGLLKACINRNLRLDGKKEEITMSLNVENYDPAYLCGRLFCKLEDLQKRASDYTLNRTIKDSYFTACATRPAVTFPKLLSLAQHHLAKLDKKAAFYADKEISEIIGLLGNEFPTILPLKDQGVFMLGYYQQKTEKFVKKETDNSTSVN